MYKIKKKFLPELKPQGNFCWEKEESYFSKQYAKY